MKKISSRRISRHGRVKGMNARTVRYVSGLALCLAMTGCVGYVQGDGGGVVVAEPDFFLFGGGYHDGGAARGYGYRGAESRGYGGGRR